MFKEWARIQLIAYRRNALTRKAQESRLRQLISFPARARSIDKRTSKRDSTQSPKGGIIISQSDREMNRSAHARAASKQNGAYVVSIGAN